jgi:hypothetical protein
MKRSLTLIAGLTVLASCSPPDTRDAPPTETTAAKPGATAAATAANDPAEAWVKATYGDEDGLTYKSGSFDLDSDGVDELLVYPAGPMRCGSGGCNLVVLRKSGDAVDKD